MMTAFAMTVLGIGSTGCDIPQRPPLAKKSDKPKTVYNDASEDGTGGESLELAGGRIDVGWDTWDAYYVGDRHVGYNHISCEVDQDSDRDDIVYEMDNVLFINQGQARTLQRLRQTSKETNKGRLINFDSSLQVGPVVTRHNGILSGLNGEGSLLQVETLRGSKRTTKTIPWDKTNRGLIAIEQSLRNRPLINKGEMRSMKVLLSGYYDVAIARLKCSGDAYVPMLDGESMRLIEINYEVEKSEGETTYSTLWIDPSGNVRRTYTPGIDLVSYRTDKMTATNLPQSIEQPLWLPVKGKIDQPAKAKRIGYEVSPLPGLIERTPEEDRDYLLDIIAAPRQTIRKVSANRFQVLVSRQQEPERRGFETSDMTPSKFDTAPSGYIDYRDRTVRRFADAAGASKSLSKEEIAIEMTRTVQSLIQKDPTKIGLVKASDVAKLSSANELGRSIFLCAMLRAKGIPSRVALGIKYQPSDQPPSDDPEEPEPPARMIYHPWTLAYVDNQWVPLDVEAGGIAPPDRITLSTATFADKSEYRAFIPFLEAVSRMQVNVLKAQY
ncbi:Transglutaminase-like superfamily protein [Rubripirellula obstinata]|uniref:Transglutaminase-like superfamily protein n=2 Tax=Rubripirellula obstinata TaxID=406547 RepID=A0A5B1CMN8_9BACT|nr:Transglutaminase-like superfamily protein [Rubripirellula obstinata]